MNVFIGFDPRQPVAFNVCAQSIWDHASQPVNITRLDLRTLPIKRRGLTEFTYSRFLVPYLSGFEGHSLFLDSDILVRGDVCDIDNITFDASVAIVKGHLRFEWASVMLFNNEKCRCFTPDYVNRAAALDLHRLTWLERVGLEIGSLPLEWNWLVGEYEPNPNAKVLHYTLGGPWFGYGEEADAWMREYRHMISPMETKDMRYLAGAS